MKQRFVRLTLAGACIAILAGALLPSAASGATIADKVAQARQLKAEIDANGEKISMLAERYNGAKIALDAVTRSISGIESRISLAQEETARTGVVDATEIVALTPRGLSGARPSSETSPTRMPLNSTAAPTNSPGTEPSNWMW